MTVPICLSGPFTLIYITPYNLSSLVIIFTCCCYQYYSVFMLEIWSKQSIFWVKLSRFKFWRQHSWRGNIKKDRKNSSQEHVHKFLLWSLVKQTSHVWFWLNSTLNIILFIMNNLTKNANFKKVIRLKLIFWKLLITSPDNPKKKQKKGVISMYKFICTSYLHFSCIDFFFEKYLYLT